MPKGMCTTSNGDLRRIKSAECVKILIDMNKYFPKLPQYLFKPEAIQGLSANNMNLKP